MIKTIFDEKRWIQTTNMSMHGLFITFLCLVLYILLSNSETLIIDGNRLNQSCPKNIFYCNFSRNIALVADLFKWISIYLWLFSWRSLEVHTFHPHSCTIHEQVFLQHSNTKRTQKVNVWKVPYLHLAWHYQTELGYCSLRKLLYL